MSTNFPTSLDTFPAAATLAGQTLFTTPHSTLHGNLGDSLAAVEAKVGIDASAVTTSLDYKVQKLLPGPSQGRLTLTTGVPVTTADVTGASTVYFTPYRGDGISLYNTSSTKWFRYTFAEISASLSGLTTSVPTDVFAYWTGSAVALELVNWTNGTTRATALTTQDGVYVKTGDATRLYLGTLCGSGSGTCEDSSLKRFVYNYYNKLIRKLAVVEATTSWSYSSATYRPMNNSTANRVQLVSGTGEDMAEFMALAYCTFSGAALTAGFNGIGVDSTSVSTIDFGAHVSVNSSLFLAPLSLLRPYPSAGFHYYQALESGGGVDTQTWYGQGSTGIGGFCFG